MPVTSLLHACSNMPVTCIMMHSNVTGPFERARFVAVTWPLRACKFQISKIQKLMEYKVLIYLHFEKKMFQMASAAN